MNTSQDHLGYLTSDAARLMRRAYEQLAAHNGITLAQARLLIYIHRAEGARQIDLADQLEIQPITLARLLDQLVAQGLAERRPSPHDRRAFLIYLTPAAQPQLEAIAAASQQIRERALQGISEDDVATTLRVLQRVRQNLCAH